MLTPAEKTRILRRIDDLRRREPQALAQYLSARCYYFESLKELQDAIEESERLTAADFAIVINAR